MPPLSMTKQILFNAGLKDAAYINFYFNWFETKFSNKFINASEKFLCEKLNFKLLSFDNKQNYLWKGNDFFVTQVEIVDGCFAHIRISDTAVKIILDKAAGQKNEFDDEFDIKNITELEAHIITGYNEFLFKSLKTNFKPKHTLKHIQPSENIVHLLFLIYDNENDELGKLILSCPDNIFNNPQKLNEPEEPLDLSRFYKSLIPVNILAGKSKIKLDEIKNIDVDDIILLENSNKNILFLNDYDRIPFKVNSLSNLITQIDNLNEGVFDMNETKTPEKNIWDSLQIDVSAEFKKIKMTLGELKQITEGLVIDIDPIIQNEILLHVDGKEIAKGELVIIGDNYGVKVTKVVKEDSETNILTQQAAPPPEAPRKEEPQRVQEPAKRPEAPAPQPEAQSKEYEEDDFDYSDFEIDDL